MNWRLVDCDILGFLLSKEMLGPNRESLAQKDHVALVSCVTSDCNQNLSTHNDRSPNSQLVCALDAEAAPAISAANPNFSVIPIKKDDELTAYFERDPGQTQPIRVGNLISDGTTLLDLVEILQGGPSPSS